MVMLAQNPLNSGEYLYFKGSRNEQSKKKLSNQIGNC